jgi:hypothetical protein
LQSFPKYIFLDTAYPLANAYIWPIPDSAYTITLTLMAPLTAFSYLTDAVTLRPAYQSALVNNLAVRMAPLHGMEAPPTIKSLAVTSKRTIEKANTQIPVLQIPRDLNRKGHYNVFSDRLT